MSTFGEIEISKKGLRSDLPKNCKNCDGNPECRKKKIKGASGTYNTIICEQCFEVLGHDFPVLKSKKEKNNDKKRKTKGKGGGTEAGKGTEAKPETDEWINSIISKGASSASDKKG